MSIVSDVITLAANNDIVELHAHDRLYWTTRKRFDELVEISSLIESAISKGASLSTLRHVFDEPKTVEEVRGRFRAWLQDEGKPVGKRASRSKSKPLSAER
jgi:antibiotic biosynthesis monooxygenase (ABM) superfamily enzyme